MNVGGDGRGGAGGGGFTDITPNSYDPLSNPKNDDYLTIKNVEASNTFVVGGNTYTLYLLGFGSSASNIVDSFRLPENCDTTSTLWAKLDQPGGAGQSAPLPAAWMLGSLLIGGLGLIRRRFAKTS